MPHTPFRSVKKKYEQEYNKKVITQPSLRKSISPFTAQPITINPTAPTTPRSPTRAAA